MHTRPRRSSLRPAIAVVLAGAAALAVAGCNIVGPLGYLVAGDPKVKPQFTLQRDKKTVVFVDDRASVLPNRSTRERMAKAAETTLASSKVVQRELVIDSARLLPVITGERFGKPAGIVEVGESVGADVVVYATVDQFSLSPDGAQFAPLASMRVKVLSVADRKRLFPTGDQEWARVDIAPEVRTQTPPRTLGERAQAERELADKAGRAVARLFVEFDPRQDDRRIGD
jgi:hypothetical protein